MKRLLPLLLILVLLLAACGEDPAADKESPAPAGEPSAAPETPAPTETPDEEKVFPPESGASTPEPAAPGGEGEDEDELPLLEESPTVEGALPTPALSETDVTLDGLSSYLRVTLPEGWTWEQAAGAVDGTVYGLWPEADPDFKVELHCWPEKFAMCGTGVTFQEYVLPNGEKATLAYEQIGEELSWILILPEAPDSFTIQFAAPNALYETHRQELELLLGSIRQGVRADLDVVTTEEVSG